MNLKGTKTEMNLLNALKGESVAANKYLYYSKVAKKEGYEQIGNILEETSNNERVHAKIWFKKLDQLKDTRENLKDCIEGENFEYLTMYPKFAKEAKEEGFDEISRLFSMVGNIEKEHSNRYKKLLDNIEKNKVFKRETTQEWICSVCGNIIFSKEVPVSICPVCEHKKAYIEINKKNY